MGNVPYRGALAEEGFHRSSSTGIFGKDYCRDHADTRRELRHRPNDGIDFLFLAVQKIQQKTCGRSREHSQSSTRTMSTILCFIEIIVA